jgi:group I intron endonuclease
MQRAWNKYGPAAFRFRALLYCARQDTLMYEQRFLDAWRPEYNSAPVAGSQLGYRFTDEAKAKMADAARRTRNFTGKRHSEATKQQISATKTGVKFGKYEPARVAAAAAAMRISKNAMTEAEVRQIRAMNGQGFPHRAIAESLGRSYWAIADVVRNRTFCWVK